MALPSFDPWRELRSLHERMDQLLSSTFGRAGDSGRMPWSPPVSVSESNGSIHVTVELPGLEKEDIDLELDENALTVRGEKKAEREEKDEHRYVVERQYGSFTRTIPLPRAIDPDAASARFKNGVLSITMPTKKNGRGRRLDIEEA